MIIPWLPQFYENAIQSKLHQLGALAERKVFEKQTSEFDQPEIRLPDGNAYGIIGRSGQMIWYGDQATITAARSIDTIDWCDEFSSKMPLALAAIFTSSTAPQVFRVNTGHFEQFGAHTPSHDGFESLLVLPSNEVTPALRSYVFKSLIFALMLGLLIGLPFVYLLNRLVIAPVKLIKQDMIDFAQSLGQLPLNANAASMNSVIGEAHNTFHVVKSSTQEKMVQQEKLATMGEVVAKVNHDMRNLLSSALLVSDRLGYTNDLQMQKSAAIVQKSIDRASNLCRQMTDYIKAPKALKPECLSLAPILKECGEDLGIEIGYEGPKELFLDGGYFYRLLHNLCHNAKKAGADHIMIIAHQVGSGIIIDFADNGPGISEDIQSKLFTAFTTSTSGSTGLGLCIARDAARVHGGDLQLLKSDSKGTTFRLHLPPMSANLDDYDRYQIQVFSNENVVDANCFIPIKIKS